MVDDGEWTHTLLADNLYMYLYLPGPLTDC